MTTNVLPCIVKQREIASYIIHDYWESQDYDKLVYDLTIFSDKIEEDGDSETSQKLKAVISDNYHKTVNETIELFAPEELKGERFQQLFKLAGEYYSHQMDLTYNKDDHNFICVTRLNIKSIINIRKVPVVYKHTSLDDHIVFAKLFDNRFFLLNEACLCVGQVFTHAVVSQSRDFFKIFKGYKRSDGWGVT